MRPELLGYRQPEHVGHSTIAAAPNAGAALSPTEHVAGLVYRQASSAPENLQDSAPAEASRVICDLDLTELQAIESPRSFGRD